ncbi:MAE_28990/MAE_18760 family HEPN-like nuclease [Paraburkholderia adhaesiva]|uniref:MAE_28990/MAE_18760 family HEPN-like nuclease n=1 Tax=Paraburkholderia adhaesiva TaxID=2883244 RepID=UPI001F4078BD|nr:MAE_28990/MAE_18760 family HEPN-like nuclease [Paraburkholderia adhaesiva]
MIRTTNELVDRIAEDLVWRRRELTDMRALVQESSGQLRCRVAIRAGVALLYAHWEGFVKGAAAHYLEYVASHRIPYRKLAPNFVALTLRSKFVEMKASEKVSSANALADFFCTSLDIQSRVPYKNVVDTKSNLSSKVLLDILTALGLDLGQFETRLHFIDTNLVNPRNHIAHGEALELTVDEYLNLHDDVLGLIETFRNEIENSAVLRRFERNVA